MTPLPPGPRLPATAQAALLAFHNIAFLDACRRRHGDAFTLRLPGGTVLVCLSTPEAARDLLAASPDRVTAGDVNAHDLGPVLGPNSLLLLDGRRHIEERRLMLPPFHGARLEAHAELIAGVTRRDLAFWPRGMTIPLWPRMRAITLEVILRAVFGVAGERLARLRELIAALLGFAGRRLLIMPAFRRDLGLSQGRVRRLDFTGVRNFRGVTITNAALLAVLVLCGHPALYLLWVAAWFTTYSLVMRIRSIAEHGMVPDPSDDLRNTRTTLARWWERLLIAPNRVNYHLEHHIMMAVPHYHLPRLHRLLRERAVLAGACVTDGYLRVLDLASSRAV